MMEGFQVASGCPLEGPQGHFSTAEEAAWALYQARGAARLLEALGELEGGDAGE